MTLLRRDQMLCMVVMTPTSILVRLIPTAESDITTFRHINRRRIAVVGVIPPLDQVSLYRTSWGWVAHNLSRTGLSLDINSLSSRRNKRHFADDSFICIFLTENVLIALKFSPKLLALVLIITWCRPIDKPLSEPMMIILQTHLCVTWLIWIKSVFSGVWIISMKIFCQKTVLPLQWEFLYWQDEVFLSKCPPGSPRPQQI